MGKLAGGLSRPPLAKKKSHDSSGHVIYFFASGQVGGTAVKTSTCTLPRCKVQRVGWRVSVDKTAGGLSRAPLASHVIFWVEFLWSHDIWGYFFVPRDSLTEFFLVT